MKIRIKIKSILPAISRRTYAFEAGTLLERYQVIP